jgi:phosphoribosylpyrophosphate synthetase
MPARTGSRVVLPYLCHARKDRRTKTRDPFTARYVAAMCEALDIDRIITMDVHNLRAFENASVVQRGISSQHQFLPRISQ